MLSLISVLATVYYTLTVVPGAIAQRFVCVVSSLAHSTPVRQALYLSLSHMSRSKLSDT